MRSYLDLSIYKDLLAELESHSSSNLEQLLKEALFPLDLQEKLNEWEHDPRYKQYLYERYNHIDYYLLKSYLPELLRDSCLYPGSFTDWSPLRQLRGVVRSFIFYDASIDSLTIFKSLEQFLLSNDVIRFKIFESDNFFLQRLDDSVMDQYQIEYPEYHNISAEGQAWWCVFEDALGNHTSLLVFRQEAVRGMLSLYKTYNCSPKAIVLIDHNTFFNIYRFDNVFEQIFRKKVFDLPEIFILNSPYTSSRFHMLEHLSYKKKLKAKGYSCLFADLAKESQHQDYRWICLKNTSPLIQKKLEIEAQYETEIRLLEAEIRRLEVIEMERDLERKKRYKETDFCKQRLDILIKREAKRQRHLELRRLRRIARIEVELASSEGDTKLITKAVSIREQKTSTPSRDSLEIPQLKAKIEELADPRSSYYIYDYSDCLEIPNLKAMVEKLTSLL